MLEGFGQAPVCLQLDLDSYDGPWTHVERFRGRSGWLVVAEARVTTFGDEWSTTLVAACDAYGEAVPHFMAPNLLGCACSHPRPCDELPPQELDELLDEAAHHLRLGWLRDNNRGLLTLSRAGAERIATLEAATRGTVEEADHAIADLRRRRRMPGVSPHAIAVFNEAITATEVDREAALHHLAVRRSQVRRAIEEEELALLRKSAVRVTWEPLYHVNWSASGRVGEDELAVREHVASTRRIGGAFGHSPPRIREHDGEDVAFQLAAHLARASREQAAKTAAAKVLAPAAVEGEHHKLARQAVRLVRQVDALHANNLAIGRGYLIRMVALRRSASTLAGGIEDGDPAAAATRAVLADVEKQLSRVEAMLATRRTQTVASAPAPPSCTKSSSDVRPSPPVEPKMDRSIRPASVLPTPTVLAGNGKLKVERDLLARQLAELETTGRKYLRGSPKFEGNRMQRAQLAERIRALDSGITGSQAPVSCAEPSLLDQRAALEAELRRHEQRGARPSDGAQPYRQYRDRRLSLLGRIAELNARIARLERREGRA